MKKNWWSRWLIAVELNSKKKNNKTVNPFCGSTKPLSLDQNGKGSLISVRQFAFIIREIVCERFVLWNAVFVLKMIYSQRAIFWNQKKFMTAQNTCQGIRIERFSVGFFQKKTVNFFLVKQMQSYQNRCELKIA